MSILYSIDRLDFVPNSIDLKMAYEDIPVDIGWDTTISAPNVHFLTLYYLSKYITSKKGVKKGVSDCLIFEPRKGFAGFFIELKCGKNKPTDYQIMFLENAKKRGYKTLVSWSLDEVIFEVENYLS
jgi:hypothetical protein